MMSSNTITLSHIDIGIVIAYIVITLGIGFYYGRGTKNLKDYATGGQDFSVSVIFGTIFASFTGANALLGLAEQAFNMGIIFFVAILGEPLYTSIVSRYVVPHMGKFTECITVGDMLAKEYGPISRLSAGFLALLDCMGTVAIQIYGLSILLKYIFGIDTTVALVAICFVTVLYSTLGGIRAVVSTDLIQFIVLIVAIPIVSALATQKAGGVAVIVDKSLITKPDFGTKEILFIVCYFIFNAIPTFNPVFMQRMFLTKNIKNLAEALNLFVKVRVPFILILAFMAGAAYTLENTLNPQEVFPFIVETTLPNVLKGLALAGAFAIIMSTIDSFMNVASVSFTRDIGTVLFPKLIKRFKPIHIAQLISVLVGVGSFFIAQYFDNIISILFFFTEPWGAIIAIPVYAVIYNYRGTKKDFILAGIISTACMYTVKAHIDVGGLPNIIGLIVSALVFFRRGILTKLGLIKSARALS